MPTSTSCAVLLQGRLVTSTRAHQTTIGTSAVKGLLRTRVELLGFRITHGCCAQAASSHPACCRDATVSWWPRHTCCSDVVFVGKGAAVPNLNMTACANSWHRPPSLAISLYAHAGSNPSPCEGHTTPQHARRAVSTTAVHTTSSNAFSPIDATIDATKTTPEQWRTDHTPTRCLQEPGPTNSRRHSSQRKQKQIDSALCQQARHASSTWRQGGTQASPWSHCTKANSVGTTAMTAGSACCFVSTT